LNPKDHLYQHYGARGVTICDAWRDDFPAFVKAIGPDPGSKYQVGRIDNDRSYEPGNVRWETRTQNMRNKRSTRWVEVDGERMCLKEACERKGVAYKKAHDRITRLGWPMDKALSL
jgi:hypothetical protein